jgi:hypothetical protein
LDNGYILINPEWNTVRCGGYFFITVAFFKGKIVGQATMNVNLVVIFERHLDGATITTLKTRFA